MAEYIKREDAIQAITWNGLSEPEEIIRLTLLTAQQNIRRISTADVVTRAEAENYKSIAETQQKLSIERYFQVKQLKSDIEQLQAEKDALTKNYAECMKDYAREIFEEIEEQIDRGLSVITKILNAKGSRANGKTVLLSKYDVFIEAKKYIAKLKKKYTEEKG